MICSIRARVHAIPWLALLMSLPSACDSGPPPRDLDLPPRAPNAIGGEGLAAHLQGMELADREEQVYREFTAGNVPSWFRRLRPVTVERSIDGTEHQVTFWVAPDYLAVGSDEDYLHVPLSPQTAQRIADLLDASLPTPFMVDQVWRAAGSRLAPQRIPPQDSVQSVRTVGHFVRHTSVIQGQRMLKHVSPDAFVAGHKKDIVLSPEVQANPGNVAVYGMHGTDGTPTQGLSATGRSEWVYYNHGVRLVDRRILVDGVEEDLVQLLRDPALARLLSTVGPLERPRYPTDPPPPDGKQ